MKKKIKDLNYNECQKICVNHLICDTCPLYFNKKCLKSLLTAKDDISFKKLRKYIEKEVEVEDEI